MVPGVHVLLHALLFAVLAICVVIFLILAQNKNMIGAGGTWIFTTREIQQDADLCVYISNVRLSAEIEDFSAKPPFAYHKLVKKIESYWATGRRSYQKFSDICEKYCLKMYNHNPNEDLDEDLGKLCDYLQHKRCDKLKNKKAPMVD